MEVIAEVEPTRSREKLENWIPPLRGLADWIDVPESPLGVARAHSVAVASYIQARYGIPAIAHVRTADVNRIAFRSIVGAAVLLGVKRLVALRGDEPRGASACSDLTPEESLREIEAHGLGVVEGGLLVSARKDPKEVERRLSSSPSFALVLNATPRRLGAIAGIARRYGVRLYPYIIVVTEGNKWLTSSMPEYVPRYEPREALKVAVEMSRHADGIVVSVPGDYRGLADFLEMLRHSI